MYGPNCPPNNDDKAKKAAAMRKALLASMKG